MGNVETMYELRGTTRFAIASELVSYSVDNSNLTMTNLFQKLAGEGAPPEQIARQMAIAANAKSVRTADGKHSGYESIVAVDIGKVGELKSAINTLVRQMEGAMPKEREAILAAYDATGKVHGNNGDLWKLTAQLQQRVKSPGVLDAIARVRAAQQEVMIHDKDAKGGEVGGLSIFLPDRGGIDAAISRESYGESRFAKETGWIDFLHAIAKPAAPPAPPGAAATPAPKPAPLPTPPPAPAT